MTDREKVIKGLEACIDNNCRDCPYPCYCEYADDWPKELHRDALALLREQEPKTDTMRNRLCPRCGAKLKGRYCLECGQAVKWND